MTRTTDPPVSEAQRRAMGAAASGHSNLGIPKSVGKEFINADPGGKLKDEAKDMTKAKDVTEPRPASGPMSTKGPSDGNSEGLPKAATPGFSPGAKDSSVGKAMSMQDIKDCYGKNSMDKRR